MNSLAKNSNAQLARLEALASLVAVMLGTMPAVNADERTALLRRCATTADGVARELASLQLVKDRS